MKNFSNMHRHTALKITITIILGIHSVSSYAQNVTGKKERLFNNISESASCTATALPLAFTATAGQIVSLPLSGSFSFSGTVVSNVRKYDNLQTVLIKSAGTDASMLTISKITNEDGSFTYRGTILNTNYADCLEIKEAQKGEYVLVKKEVNKVIAYCDIKTSAR